MNWSVDVEFAGEGEAPAEDALFDLLEFLEPFNASVTGSPEEPRNGKRRYGASMLVEADSPDGAVGLVLGELSRGIKKFDLPSWPLVRLEVMSEEELEEQLSRPTYPRLLGISELADLLGTSKQRASQVARGGNFPKPLAELAAGPVWTEPSVRQFIEHWTRTPGRPKRAEV
jgi:hypothetical protein